MPIHAVPNLSSQLVLALTLLSLSLPTLVRAGALPGALPEPLSAEAAEPDRSMAWVRARQAGGGLLGGAALGLAGALVGMAATPCSSHPDDGGCGLESYAMGIYGGIAGYLIGAPAGIYWAGHSMDRDGSFLVSLAGAAAGFAGGAYLAWSTNMPVAPSVIVSLGLSNLVSLGLYSWTDRVETRVSLEPALPGARESALALSPKDLRAETRVVLWRL